MEKGFPRTDVGGVSVPRMIVGTNWFLGYSHCTQSKTNYIIQNVKNRKSIADILEVFFNSGINAVMGQIRETVLYEAIRETEDRTGTEAIIISTPHLSPDANTLVKGFINDETKKILDNEAAHNAVFCMPHQGTTDLMVDRCARRIRKFGEVAAMIRERGMIPGLSTHMPEAIVIADESGLDVETYISIYNAMGFLMQVEVDWTAKIIHEAKKPVMTIKPMASGHIRPFQALTFVWNTLRDQDMVTVGTMSPDEAKELIELSLSILEKRKADIELQTTRSKAIFEKRK